MQITAFWQRAIFSPALVIMAAIALTAEASTVPIANGNRWVFMYGQTALGWSATAARTGKLSLVISSVNVRSDSTFFTLSCSDSVTYAASPTQNSTSSAQEVLYAGSIFPVSSQIVSAVDVGRLLSYTRPKDTSYTISGFNSSASWSSNTDSSSFSVNGVLSPLLTTSQTDYHSGEQVGFWYTKDTTQWIDQIGTLKYSHHYAQGYISASTDTLNWVILISFNDIPVQELGVTYQPVRHTSGNQPARNSASKHALLRTFVTAKSIPGFYFNVRGQAVPCLQNSQIIVTVPKH
jgi:hypothetical protein